MVPLQSTKSTRNNYVRSSSLCLLLSVVMVSSVQGFLPTTIVTDNPFSVIEKKSSFHDVFFRKSLPKQGGGFIADKTTTTSGTSIITTTTTTTTTRLYNNNNKLWDRLQVEEDEEPFWYLINCVAGLEMDLLRQCREACKDLPDENDVIKFVVPTEIKTRSHGANKMVTETKVKYQGYVFAKLRLCPETYEAIQQ